MWIGTNEIENCSIKTKTHKIVLYITIVNHKHKPIN